MEDVDISLSKAKSFLEQNMFQKSIDCLSTLLVAMPNNEQARFLLVQAYLSLGNHIAIKENITAILKNDKPDLPALKLLFKSLLQQELLFEAYAVIKKIIADEATLDNQYELAIICTRIGKIKEAKELLELYTNKIDNNAFAFLNLGHMYKAYGDFELAEKCYYKFTELEPTRLGYALWNIADLKDRNVSEQELTQWRKLESDNSQTEISKLLIQFSLGTVLDRQQDYENAFKYFLKANNNKDKTSPFNKKAFQQFINNILSQNVEIATSEPKTITPIFIVGLPRSGSTLVEQIVSSHDLVNATDELNFIGHTAAKMERTGSYSNAVSALDDNQVKELRQAYIDYAAEYQTSETPYFIDKNPLNFFHIGLILKLFPEAIIIHTHRNLLDNAASLFKRYFYVGHDYSYSLANIVSFMEGYAEVMRHWDALYPNKIFHSRYETLVESPKKQISSILSFCGLDVQEECFSFYKKKRAVLTPSVDQVNKPINNSSINSWQRYEIELGPFQSQLVKINETLLGLGQDKTKSAWNNYWQQGNITSFGTELVGNYDGAIKANWNAFFAEIDSGSRVLDIATGNGAVLELALTMLEGLDNIDLVGVDYAQVGVSNSELTLLSGINAENLPFDGNEFDHLTSQYGIEYSDLTKSLVEAARVLKSGGRFQFLCHVDYSQIIVKNRKIYDCTKELLKLGGALGILVEMLAELNKKQLTGQMDVKRAETKRNDLNNELGRLLKLYGDTLHDTNIAGLMRTVLRADIAASDRDKIMASFVDEQNNGMIRLNDLLNSALTENKIKELQIIADSSGLSSLTIKELIEPKEGVIGITISGTKI